MDLCNSLIATYDRQFTLLTRLRTFYLAVADHTLAAAETMEQTPAPDATAESLVDCLTESLPLSWQAQIFSHDFHFNTAFATNLVRQLFEWEATPETQLWVSDLELLLLVDLDFSFPTEVDHSILRPYSATFFRSAGNFCNRLAFGQHLETVFCLRHS